MYFSQLHSANSDPDLKLFVASIPVVSEFKFLGLIFDMKLTFNQHIKCLKDICIKALNLLRTVAHKDLGADCVALLKLYYSPVHSKLDYGCVVYDSDRQSILTSLDRVQNTALSWSIQNVTSFKPTSESG